MFVVEQSLSSSQSRERCPRAPESFYKETTSSVSLRYLLIETLELEFDSILYSAISSITIKILKREYRKCQLGPTSFSCDILNFLQIPSRLKKIHVLFFDKKGLNNTASSIYYRKVMSRSLTLRTSFGISELQDKNTLQHMSIKRYDDG